MCQMRVGGADRDGSCKERAEKFMLTVAEGREQEEVRKEEVLFSPEREKWHDKA